MPLVVCLSPAPTSNLAQILVRSIGLREDPVSVCIIHCSKEYSTRLLPRTTAMLTGSSTS